MVLTPRELLARSISERDYQQTIIEYAGLMGYFSYHDYDSRRSTAGFPDLVLCNGKRVLYLEVKREIGRVSAVQCQWLDLLRSAGQTALVVRPSDWPMVKKLIDGLTARGALEM